MIKFDELLRIRKLEQQLGVLFKKQNRFRKSGTYTKAQGDTREDMDSALDSKLLDVSESLERLRTTRILREAGRYEVPIPWVRSFGDANSKYWDNGFSGKFNTHLSQDGHWKLRSDIREERGARRDDFFLWWVPVITSISGLLGIATAFLALAQGRK